MVRRPVTRRANGSSLSRPTGAAFAFPGRDGAVCTPNTTLVSTTQYCDFRTLFGVSTLPDSFADNEAKGRNLIVGSDVDETFMGSFRRDWLIGGGGDDTITGTFGSDEIDGRDDTDTATYRGIGGPDNKTIERADELDIQSYRGRCDSAG